MQLFPDFIKTHTAYRAVICKPLQIVKEFFLTEAFRSWSLSLEGISEYVRLEHGDMMFSETDTVYVYEAEVEGLSLAHLCEELVKQEKLSSNQAQKFFRENELLAIQVGHFKLLTSKLVSEFVV